MNVPTMRKNPSSNDTTAWAATKNPVKPLKEIIMETSDEQKRVMEEEQKRKMNIFIHTAPESIEIESHKKKDCDNSLVSSFLEQVVGYKSYEKCYRLGRKPMEENNKSPVLCCLK